jgi:putative transposase
MSVKTLQSQLTRYRIKDYLTVPALEVGLSEYFDLYNYERPHQSLDYRTPAEVHFAAPVVN